MASFEHRGGVAGLRGWLDSALISAALLAAAAGFGEFGSVAALGEVARAFGNPSRGASIAEQAGLSGTQLGLGLAVVRLSSLLALVISGLADRFGRRATVLWACGGGLALTAAAAGAPGYWWFVAVIAMARPLLSAAGAVTQVNAAEQTGTDDRAKALALVTAGYAGGAGLIAVIHGLAGEALGLRGLFALAIVPLLLVPVLGRWFREPERFLRTESRSGPAAPVIGAIGPAFRRRLLLISGVSFGVGAITGPANSFLFVYAENVQGLSDIGVAGLVVGAGVIGLAGLVAGRWMTDHLGRRPTAAMSMVFLGLCAMLAYSGPTLALVIGYLLAITCGAAFGPAAVALTNEMFPTSVRGSVAGWTIATSVLGAVCGLLAFGAIADVGGHFGVAALLTFLPASLLAGLFWPLPETRGREPEDLWPANP
jgi:MFS family permease